MSPSGSEAAFRKPGCRAEGVVDQAASLRPMAPEAPSSMYLQFEGVQLWLKRSFPQIPGQVESAPQDLTLIIY